MPLELSLPNKALRASVFRGIDSHAVGTLTLEQTRTAVSELWPSFDQEAVLLRAYHSCEVDEKGHVSRKEFRRLLKYVVYFNIHWEEFESLAESSRASGGLSKDKFGESLSKVGVTASAAKAESEFGVLEPEVSGLVRFDAFCRWCARQHIAHDADEQEEAVPPEVTTAKKKKKRRKGGGPGPSRTPLRKAAGAGKHPAAAVDSLSRLLSDKSSKAEGGAAAGPGPEPAGRGKKPKRTRTPPRKGAAKRSGRALPRPLLASLRNCSSSEHFHRCLPMANPWR